MEGLMPMCPFYNFVTFTEQMQVLMLCGSRDDIIFMVDGVKSTTAFIKSCQHSQVEGVLNTWGSNFVKFILWKEEAGIGCLAFVRKQIHVGTFYHLKIISLITSSSSPYPSLKTILFSLVI
jgi:hypothetical protein